ncbi:HAMP domain-containing histidine kinase [Candidatus Saccharibacteria bacterium]|nr:HAMP domain-containing histidine kinase [Candidatus Saccharibacteria bacterium]
MSRFKRLNSKIAKAKNLPKDQEPAMFKKLKRRFIINSVVASTAVLLIAFSTIYAIAYNATMGGGRPPRSEFHGRVPDDISTMFEQQLEDERKSHLDTLLLTLIITGISLEIIVIIFSILHAESSIKPVRDAYEAQKNFIANASHEIKTPLAVIQANLEAADIQGNQWIDNVAKKTEELTALNNQLLSLARMESHTDEIKPEKINLQATIEDVTSCYLPKLAEKGAKLKIVAEKDNYEHTVNLPEFKQLLNILVDNAVKYCDKKITITISEKQVAVKNDGTTIPQENLSHIFDRFYQTDKTKSGVGLGLAIGKTIADHNKWHLTVDSDKKSTTFTLGL